MKLVGFIPYEQNLPCFALPIFSNDLGELYFQEINTSTDRVDNFLPIEETESICSCKSNLKLEVGDLPLFILALTDGSIISGDSNDFYLQTNKIKALNLPSSIALQFDFISGNRSTNSLAKINYIKQLKLLGHPELEKSYLESSVTFSGWEKMLSLSDDFEVKNRIKSQFKFMKFYVNSEKRIAFNSLSNVSMLEASDLELVLKELNAEFSNLIHFCFNDKTKFPEKPEDFSIDANLIDVRIIEIIKNMGRQEERLAFLLLAIIHYPSSFVSHPNYSDRARSGRMGMKVIFQEVERLKSTSGETLNLIQIAIKILGNWQSGDKHLFVLYLLKWSHNNPNLFSQLNRQFMLEYSYYPSIKRASELSNYHGNEINIPSIPSLLSDNGIFSRKTRLFKAEREFDYKMIFGR